MSSLSEKLYECPDKESLTLEYVKRLLDKKADPNVSDDGLYGYSVLYKFVARGKTEFVKLLLEYKANPYGYGNYFPVDWAVRCGYTEEALLLLEHKGNVNVSDNNRITTLMIASKHNYPEVVESLLKHKAKIDIRNDNGDTALSLACKEDNYDVAKILLKNKADVNIKSRVGVSCINHACKNNNTKMIQLLLEYKANLEPDSKLLNLTKKNSQNSIILIENGATYTTLNYKGVLQALYENNTDKALEHLQKLNLNLEEHGLLLEIAIEKENTAVIDYFKNKIK